MTFDAFAAKVRRLARNSGLVGPKFKSSGMRGTRSSKLITRPCKRWPVVEEYARIFQRHLRAFL